MCDVTYPGLSLHATNLAYCGLAHRYFNLLILAQFIHYAGYTQFKEKGYPVAFPHKSF